MEPEPEPAPDGGDVEGVPPLTAPEDAEDLASFLQRKAAEGEAPWETEWDAAGFGDALRAGFAALWPAVEAGEAAGCDVVLEAGGERLSAHGIVLTIWSEIFRTTLEDRWRAAQEEAAAAAPRCVLAVELGPSRPADVKDLLRFIYTGSTSLAPDSVMGLLHLSDYYSIDGLKRSCGDYLFRLLGKDQLPALLTSIRSGTCGSAAPACWRMISRRSDRAGRLGRGHRARRRADPRLSGAHGAGRATARARGAAPVRAHAAARRAPHQHLSLIHI